MGAPPPTSVYLDKSNGSLPDPTLDACCRRDEEASSAYSRARGLVRSQDRVAEKERRAKETLQPELIVQGGRGGESHDSCRCCGGEEGEYPGLKALRDIVKQQQEQEDAGGIEDDGAGDRAQTSDTDSDGSEFDYLLDDEQDPMADMRRLELVSAAERRMFAASHGYGGFLHARPGSFPDLSVGCAVVHCYLDIEVRGVGGGKERNNEVIPRKRPL